jgi:hypothetical protein
MIGHHRSIIAAALALVLGVFGAALQFETSYADVTYVASGGSGYWGARFSEIRVFGTISKADARYFEEHAIELERNELAVYLDSLGGDVDAAMQIGRIIRRNESSVFVSKTAKCYSSFVLIYIGGVERYNEGAIGLHRPYFASAPQSRRSIEREAPLMLQTLKAYVHEMGITDNFYQEMVNTEPSQMKLYLGSSVRSLVPKLDPTYDEIETAYEARSFGIDTAEWRIRKSECSYDDIPPLPPGVSFCKPALSWGLSDSVAERRLKHLDHCQLSSDEKRELGMVPRRERRDHPLYLKREACIRNVMLGR